MKLSQRTDSDGKFHFDNAPDGTIEFGVHASGYRTERKQLVARDKPYRIVLSSPLKISGKVIDAETGEPISKFEVPIGILLSGAVEFHWLMTAKQFEDLGGSFELNFTNRKLKYKVRAVAEGYDMAEYPGIFEIGQNARDIVIALRKKQ